MLLMPNERQNLKIAKSGHSHNSSLIQLWPKRIMPCCRARYFGTAKILQEEKENTTAISDRRYLAMLQNLLECVARNCLCSDTYELRNSLKLRLRGDGIVTSTSTDDEIWYRERAVTLTILADLVIVGLDQRTKSLDNIWAIVQGGSRYRDHNQKQQILTALNNIKQTIKQTTGRNSQHWIDELTNTTGAEHKMNRVFPRLFCRAELSPEVLSVGPQIGPGLDDQRLAGVRTTTFTLWFCLDCKQPKQVIGRY